MRLAPLTERARALRCLGFQLDVRELLRQARCGALKSDQPAGKGNAAAACSLISVVPCATFMALDSHVHRRRGRRRLRHPIKANNEQSP